MTDDLWPYNGYHLGRESYQKLSEHDQEIPQSQTADQPTAS